MSKVLDEMYNEGFKDGFKEGFRKGFREGYREGYREGIALMLSRTMQHNSWTLEQALRVSGCPLEKRDYYAALIEALPAQYQQAKRI